jgi:hypothetical protein
VVCLGHRAYEALLGAYRLPLRRFRDAVESDSADLLPTGAAVVPVYHCGQRTLNTHRPIEAQRRDWQRVRRALDRVVPHGVPGAEELRALFAEYEARLGALGLQDHVGNDSDAQRSALFMAELRGAGVLADAEWNQVLEWVRESIEEVLSIPSKRAHVDELRNDADAGEDLTRGAVLLLDADARSADWLRIATTVRKIGYRVPDWAALWVHRLGRERDDAFWREVTEVAAGRGFARAPSD